MRQCLNREVAIRRGGPSPETDAVVSSHEHDIHDLEREPVVHRVTLRHITKAQPRFHRDRAGKRLQGSEDRAPHRGLPGAIRSDQTKEISFGDLEAQIRKHDATPIPERRVVEPDERVCHYFTALATTSMSYFINSI